jgi:hypothetical protein
VVTINKATIASNVWKTVKDAMVSGVTSVTLADSSTQTIQTYTSSFPDKVADTSSLYPILVVNPVELSWEDHTFTKKWANGSFEISIFSTNSQACDLFGDKIIDTIETNRDDFRALGMTFIELERATPDEFNRGQIKVHVKNIRFTFKFSFDITQTW